jgi:formate dehydrogenase/NADH-quinone oxidoreductase subunit F
VGSTKAHTLLRDVLESGNSTLDDAQRGRILQLEEAMRKTSICGLGQVALGPVVSVLGLAGASTGGTPPGGVVQPDMRKGGAAAREQPRPDGAAAQPDR